MNEIEIIDVPFADDDLEGVKIQTRTYRMDHKNKRIVGMVDGAEAAAQAMFKALQTRRFAYLIYDSDYGCDLFNKIGNSDLTAEYLDSDIPAMIEEALLIDESITSVDDISFEILDGDSVALSFSVRTIYGDSSYEGVLGNG